MYGFSEDEDHLLFMDSFGLTRLSRPKQAKTDTKISGSEAAGRVTVSRDGSAAASYEDSWDKTVVWSFPELKSAKRFDRFQEREAIVHPEGAHYIVPERGTLVIKPLTKAVLLPLRLDAPAEATPKSAKPVTLELTGGEELPTLALGEGDGRLDVPVSLRIAHDGTLLHFDGKQLICAALEGSAATVRWRRALTGPAGARLELHADAERCVLMLHQGPRWIIFERSAGGERSFEIESLGVPAVAGRYLAYQPKPELVIRRELATDEQTEHGLAIYDKKRKIDLRNEGVGTLFVGAKGSLLFLTGHRESVLDLSKGAEIPRKLPAKEFEIRQAVLAIARPYIDAARLAGITLELSRVELNSKHSSVSVSHRIVGGENLFGALLASHSGAVWGHCELPGSWRMSSYGSSGGVGYDPDVTVEALVAGYTALADNGIGFASTIQFWAGKFDTYEKPPRDVASLALLAQALVAVVRDGADAKLDYAALAERGLPSIDEIITAYAAYPQRTQELDYAATKLSGHLFNRLYGAGAAPIWVAVYLEAKGWTNFGTAYSDFGGYAAEPLLKAHPEAAAVFKAWFDTHELTGADGRAYNLNRLREQLGS